MTQFAQNMTLVNWWLLVQAVLHFKLKGGTYKSHEIIDTHSYSITERPFPIWWVAPYMRGRYASELRSLPKVFLFGNL